MPLSKAHIVLLVALSTLIALAFPLLVYYTYPDTGESEVGLEKVLVDMPVKPPPFLIGSMGYASHRGRDFISKFTVRSVDHVITAYVRDKDESIILVLLPYYLEKSTGKIIPGDYLKQVVSRGNVTLVVEVFETYRGRVCIILEAMFNDEIYSAVRSLR
ncbi:MAG: hypothetical protein QW211_05275 [Desulfurococcaceae archaeon]